VLSRWSIKSSSSDHLVVRSGTCHPRQYPVALTLWEVISGVVLTKRWGQLSLKRIRSRRFFFFVTDEAVDTFPKLREIPHDLRIGALGNS
jgi:hypothetical protein